MTVTGRVRKVIPPTGPAVDYSYDVEDQLVGVQRGGATTSLSYDLGGRKLGMSDPDMGTWNYAYDALGNLIRQTDARGQRVCLYYDSLNRLTGKHYRSDDTCPATPPSLDASYSYDEFNEATGQYGRGYRTGMVDPSGETSWKYDPRGRVVEETKTVTGVSSFRSAWSYTSADLLAGQVYPADASGGLGESLTFSYHPQAALKSVYSNLSYYYVQNITYDVAGRVDVRKLGATSLASSQLWQTDYDYFPWSTPGGQGRLQRLKSGTYANATSLQDLTYSYDLLGNVLSIVNTKANGAQTQSFSYDLLDRLLSSQASGGTQGVYPLESYTYNAATGNLESKAGVSYSYAPQSGSCPQGALSKPHAVTSAGTSSYCYDLNGNMVRRTIGGSVYNLTYDAENRLVSVSGNGVSAAFVYDGDGKRVQGTINGVVTTYIGEAFEWSGSTATMKKYYYAGGTRLAVRIGSTLNWLLGDHLGSTNITANSSAIQTGKLLYKPWGEERFSSGTTPTSFKFTGQRQESSLGLYYYGARWYDPYLNRWTQPDTIVPDPYNPQDWDRYSYVRNNPIKYIDPTGYAQVCADGDWGGDCGAGSNAEQIYTSFDHDHGGRFDGLFAEYYAKLFEARIHYSQGDYLSAEAMFADAAATKERALAFVPQNEFNPLMAISPLDLYNVSKMVVGVGKDLVSSAAIFPWMFRDFQHERKAYGARGWSPANIDQTLQYPALTREGIDKRTNQKVTYYYRSDGHYVVQNDITGEILQVSNTTNPNWIDPLTNLPIGPIAP
jgi:RHS repeat-associated protein